MVKPRRFRGAALLVLLLGLTISCQSSGQYVTVRGTSPRLPPGVRYLPNIAFRIQGADTIFMDLLLPNATLPRPAIVLVGGSHGATRSAQLGEYAAELAARGFVSAIIDYRPRALGTRLPLSAASADAKLAVRWLRANATAYGVDKARVGLVGAGEGGLVAAVAGLPNWFGVGSNDNVRFPSEVQAVALLEPLLDLADTTLSEPARAFLDTVLTAGAPAQGRSGGLEIDLPLRERISPVNYFGGDATRDVREHVPPFWLAHGTADRVFPFRHSERLAGELRAHGFHAEVFPANGEGHGFFQRNEWKNVTVDALADFFQRTLGDSVAPVDWLDATPMWAPGGDAIVFHSTYGGEWGVWVVSTDGTQLRRLAAGREAAWSPDGLRVAFESGEGRLATAKADGSDFRLVTADTGEFVHAPSWSPDGSHIAVSSWVDNQLHLVRLSDGHTRRLTNTSGGNGCSSWFPDGSRVAFHSSRDGQAELYVMAIADGVATRLTNTQTHEFCPRVSPDGRRVAFQRRTSDVHERIDIWVMDLASGAERNVTNHRANDRWASWSPDGAWIAFTSTRGGNSDIYVVRADGSGLRRITSR
jgi:dipeptidyl aminopeptidase/acylaminoacyl peptidase